MVMVGVGWGWTTDYDIRTYIADKAYGNYMEDTMGYGQGQMQARNDAAASIEARVRPTTLATIAVWMDKMGWKPRTKSELVRMSMEALEEQIVVAGIVPRVEWTEEALGILATFGLEGFNRNRRGGRALAQQLQEDERAREILGRGRDRCVEGDTKQRIEGGMLFASTMQELLDLGYRDFEVDGRGLSEEVMRMLRMGKMPPRIKTAPMVECPSILLDRPETLEEAQARREAEAAREKAAMIEAIRARRGEQNG